MFFPRTVLGRIEAEFPNKCAFFRNFPKKNYKKNLKKIKKKIKKNSIFLIFFLKNSKNVCMGDDEKSTIGVVR